jgi:hypothetical protein
MSQGLERPCDRPGKGWETHQRREDIAQTRQGLSRMQKPRTGYSAADLEVLLVNQFLADAIAIARDKHTVIAISEVAGISVSTLYDYAHRPIAFLHGDGGITQGRDGLRSRTSPAIARRGMSRAVGKGSGASGIPRTNSRASDFRGGLFPRDSCAFAVPRGDSRTLPARLLFLCGSSRAITEILARFRHAGLAAARPRTAQAVPARLPGHSHARGGPYGPARAHFLRRFTKSPRVSPAKSSAIESFTYPKSAPNS